MARKNKASLASVFGELIELVFDVSKISWKVGAGLAAVFAVLTLWTFFAVLGSVTAPRAGGIAGVVQAANFLLFGLPVVFAAITVLLGIGAIKRHREEKDLWPKF